MQITTTEEIQSALGCMRIQLGKTEVSLLNPPNDGIVVDNGHEWRIGRNGGGLIVLRAGGEVHPAFVAGMDMQTFCEWINCHLGCL